MKKFSFLYIAISLFAIFLVTVNVAKINASSKDFTIKNGVLIKYNGTKKNVVIPNSVKKIGVDAFRKSSIVKITIPDTVTEIGLGAFDNCNNLTTVIMSNKLIKIDDYAFVGCKNLINITFPKSLKVIGKSAFSSCESLEEVSLPNTVTSIGESAFINCYSLSYIKFPKNLKQIPYNVMQGCTKLETVILPEKLEIIEERAFFFCFKLKSIELPPTLISIDKDAFLGSGLTSITIPENVKDIAKNAFDDCDDIEEVILPDRFKDIEHILFANSKWLDNILIENPLYIRNGVLLKATYASGDVIIPNEVHTIEDRAFARNKLIHSIVIPKTVKKMGENVFDGCLSLKTAIFENNIKTIPSGTFEFCHSLTTVILPKKLKTIKYRAFVGTNIKSITLPESVVEIYDEAFGDKLEEINFPNSIRLIEQYALSHTKWYKNFSKGKDLVIINDVLLNGNNTKGNVIVPKNIKYISPLAFENSKATSIILNENLQEIGYHCFGYNVKSITIPKTVKKFGRGIILSSSTKVLIQKNSPIDKLLKDDPMTKLITYY